MGARCFARHSIEDKPLSKMKKNSIYKIVSCRALYSGKAFPFYRGKIHGDKTNKSPSFPKLSHFVIFRILIALSLIFREIHGNPIQLPGVLGELKAMPSLEQQNMVAFHIWSRGATEKNTYYYLFRENATNFVGSSQMNNILTYFIYRNKFTMTTQVGHRSRFTSHLLFFAPWPAWVVAPVPAHRRGGNLAWASAMNACFQPAHLI